jgi:hypothetical protein
VRDGGAVRAGGQEGSEGRERQRIAEARRTQRRSTMFFSVPSVVGFSSPISHVLPFPVLAFYRPSTTVTANSTVPRSPAAPATRNGVVGLVRNNSPPTVAAGAIATLRIR